MSENEIKALATLLSGSNARFANMQIFILLLKKQ